MNSESYDDMVKKASPDSPLLKDCIRAFAVGGLICVIGQMLTNFALNYGLDEKSAATFTSVTLIVAASLLTGLGLYSKIGKFAGAGSIVPIPGFSNSVTSPAVEFKKEGYVLGLGSKIFIIAGPVILYGVLTSIIVGMFYYFAGR
ncbi:MAG: stage V sporulation protein AC [Firmicutes bacterium]|nr:stage V sporulation protein AC [Bacillota bacterium]